MRKHKVFVIAALPFNIDLISGQLWNLDIEGITENEMNLIVYSSPKSSVSINEIEDELKKLKQENLIETYEVEENEIEEINWNEEWEKKFSPIQVTDRIIIKPSFKPIESSQDKLIITIDPKMSFGTGEHETTKLVLQLMEKVYDNHTKVLDVGSGTAVLAIAAAKFGAENVIAIDNDEWCLENGLENVQLNLVEDKVKVQLGEIDSVDDKDFDLVLANINKHILVDIAEKISDKIKDNGDLILSGLLNIDEDDIKEVYAKKGFQFISLKRMNEWIALHFNKRI
ncbi:MAG: 50S ribosomal protein L11 methyltransferase [Melioribacteraceae bacterium]|nr:50S ribosomal protein L11 methyltransferase [Melioribacteraceae bacterium]